MPNKKSVTILATMFATALLVILVTWAWIEGTVSPGIDGSNMKIGAGTGLIMKLNGTYTEEIDLNQYVGDISGSEFTLTEASSADGKSIYVRTVGDKDGDKDMVVLTTGSDSAKSGFISLTFTLLADGEATKIWFDPEKTYIRRSNGDNLNALRMSLQVQRQDRSGNWYDDTGGVKIFSTRSADSGASYARLRGVASINSDGTFGDGNLENVTVYPLTAYTGENPWLSLEKEEKVSVTMRIWLEGTDADCVDALSESSYDFGLFFATPQTTKETEESSGTGGETDSGQ